MKRNRGFTVVELLISIAIMAAFLAIGLGFTRRAVGKAYFNASLNKFVADFSKARQLASRLNRYVAIDFDESGGYYTMRVQETLGDFSDDNFTKNVQDEYHQPDNQAFFDGASAQDLVVNSLGIVRAYPMQPNDPPVKIQIEFIQVSKGTYEKLSYKKRMTIFPSGGIKVEEYSQY